MKIISRLFISLIAASAISTDAAIIDLGNITRDTGTGLDWLDLTESRGLSYNQVASELGINGLYYGWRFATVYEFDTLIKNFGYVAIKNDCSFGLIYCDDNLSHEYESEIIENMIKTLGDTDAAAYAEGQHSYEISPSGAGYVGGYFSSNLASPSGVDFGAIFDGEYVYGGNNKDSAMSLMGGTDPNTIDVAFGSFLVRASEVPVPASAWLMGSGLICLAGISRLKK